MWFQTTDSYVEMKSSFFAFDAAPSFSKLAPEYRRQKAKHCSVNNNHGGSYNVERRF